MRHNAAEEMTRLLNSLVKKSFALLANKPPPIPKKVQDLADSVGQPVASRMRDAALTPTPIIFTDGSGKGATFSCVQHDFFGFYVLQEGLRSVLKAVNFQIGGIAALASELYAPAITLLYSAAYHALSGFLATRGRVLLDEQEFHWIGAAARPSVMAACLTRSGRWKFEKRKRNHRSRWLELRAIFDRHGYEIPEYFYSYFHRLFYGLTKPSCSVMEAILDPLGTRARLEDNVDMFLKRVSEIRHTAIYQGSGEDPDVVYALVNRETFSARGIDGQASGLGEFSHELLADAARTTCSLLSHAAKLRPGHKLLLVVGTGFPWVDMPRLDKWESDAALSDLEALWSWLELPSDAGEELARMTSHKEPST